MFTFLGFTNCHTPAYQAPLVKRQARIQRNCLMRIIVLLNQNGSLTADGHTIVKGCVVGLSRTPGKTAGDY